LKENGWRCGAANSVPTYSIFATFPAKYLGNWIGPFVDQVVGTAFLAKMLQAFLVVPAFALVYLMVAPVSLRKRVGQVAIAAGAACRAP